MPLINFPLALANLPAPRVALFHPESAVGGAVSPFTFQSQMQVHAGQRWVLTVEYPPSPEAEAADLMADLTALNGREGSFLFGPLYTRRGVATGTPLVDGAGQTSAELSTKGWTPSTLVLRKNDYIGLGSGAGSRLHKILMDVTSDSSGDAVLPIWPRPRGAYADEAPLIVDSPQAVFRLNSNKRDWVQDLVTYGITIEATEVIEENS